MLTEEELLKQIAENDYDLKQARGQVALYKEKLLEAETALIGHKLKDERLREQLRLVRLHTVKPNEQKTAYEEDIERFRQRLPELLEKLK